MKKNSLWLLLVLAAIMFISCSKDSTTETNNNGTGGDNTTTATCQIIDPVNVDSINAGAVLTIKVKVKAGTSLVDQITYYANNTQIYQQNGQSNSNDTIFSYNWTIPVSSINYQLKVIIRDKEGKTGSSQIINLKTFNQIDGNFIWAKDYNVYSLEFDENGNAYIRDSNTLKKLDAAGNVVWSRSFGGVNQILDSYKFDAQGNVYFFGSFRDSITLGTTSLVSAGQYDYYVAKMNASGDWLWAKRFGGTDHDYRGSLVLDAQNSLYLCGGFSGMVDFGTGSLTSVGNYDAFVGKMDSDGNWLWVKRAGGTGYDCATGILIDTQGNIILQGLFKNTAEFGNISLISAGGDDFFIAKMTLDGNWAWAIRSGTNNDEDSNYNRGVSLCLDNQNNLYLSVCFYAGTIGNASASGRSVAKISAAGSLQWIKQDIGISGNSFKLIVDSQGNPIIAGQFSGTITVGVTTLTSFGASDIGIAKMDNNANWLWAKQAGGIDLDDAGSVAVDAQNNVYLTGSYSGNANFGAILLNAMGSSDIYVAKMNSTGSWQWARSAGGAGLDYGSRISIDAQSNVFVSGGYGAPATFGETVLTIYPYAGDTSPFLAKIR